MIRGGTFFFDGPVQGGSKFTLSFPDPTAARTITVPDADLTFAVKAGSVFTIGSTGFFPDIQSAVTWLQDKPLAGAITLQLQTQSHSSNSVVFSDLPNPHLITLKCNPTTQAECPITLNGKFSFWAGSRGFTFYGVKIIGPAQGSGTAIEVLDGGWVRVHSCVITQWNYALWVEDGSTVDVRQGGAGAYTDIGKVSQVAYVGKGSYLKMVGGSVGNGNGATAPLAFQAGENSLVYISQVKSPQAYGPRNRRPASVQESA